MQNIRETCEFFADVQVWPDDPKIEYDRWLSNFREEELPYAKDLISSFFLFNNKMCKQILKASVQRLSLYALGHLTERRQSEWEDFIDSTIFTTVDIEEGNLTASGNLICRWGRQYLEIDESRFKTYPQALRALNSGSAKNVVFLDDLIGSGEQFTNTWTTPHQIDGKLLSFPRLCQTKGIRAFYLPLVATEWGIGEIFKTCSDIVILPGNILDGSYGALHEKSILWSEGNHAGAKRFIEDVSKRAGIDVNYFGYKDLALTVMFSHSIPDATLPLLYWKKNGWKPLMELS